MAELEVDRTNLPLVQEVRQCFAVLEDGALAHNLQEQEIEQHYSTNIQKNQLAQNDLRVAKRLQEQEEEQWAQESALQRQASKQLEERDFEYARSVQEELLRCAEEAQRRERDDQEMAKRIQDEETQFPWRTSRGQNDPREGSAATLTLPPPPPPRHTLGSPERLEEQCSSSPARWRPSSSYGRSCDAERKVGSRSAVAAPTNRDSWSNEGRADAFRDFRSTFREPSSEDSEDSDSVFLGDSVPSKRAKDRLQTPALRRQGSLDRPHAGRCRSLNSHSSSPGELRVWEEEREAGEEEQCGHGGAESSSSSRRRRRRPWIWPQELHRLEDSGEESGSDEVRDGRCSRSQSVRLHDRRRQSNPESARTWCYQESADKRVRFRDDSRRESAEAPGGGGVWAMLGHALRVRGVPVRMGNDGASLQIVGPQRRDGQASRGGSPPHQRSFHRASTTRHSFHGDIGEKRRSSHRESGGRERRDGGELHGISSRDPHLARRETGGSRRRRDSKYSDNHARERSEDDSRLGRTSDERSSRYNGVGGGLNSEEEAQRRRDQPGRRGPRRSQSLRSSISSSRASVRRRSGRSAAGAGEAGLDLGELQQVLQDEELARKMQEDEEKRLRRNWQPSPSACYPEGDFRAAQVAQDEEIARFMQKQEMTSRRRSRELEGPSWWHEHSRAARDRQVQRERLDSEGLPSPSEDGSPENQPPGPACARLHGQSTRNVAEELDPTFRARRQSAEREREGQTGPTPPQQRPEEPTFIPPTKRQADKPKPKEKKETCKQQ